MAYRDAEQLRALLKHQLEGKWATARRTWAGFSDNRFWAPPRSEIDELATAAKRNPSFPDVGEAYDCDDYAFALKGLVSQENRRRGRNAGICIGIAWGVFAWMPRVHHAVNWAIDDENRLLWIEPQTGSVEDASSCNGGLELLIV